MTQKFEHMYSDTWIEVKTISGFNFGGKLFIPRITLLNSSVTLHITMIRKVLKETSFCNDCQERTRANTFLGWYLHQFGQLFL